MRSQRLRYLLLASVGWSLVLTVSSLPGAPPALVTICHKPGTPAESTKRVAENALPAHLHHGDFLGSCEGGLISGTVQAG